MRHRSSRPTTGGRRRPSRTITSRLWLLGFLVVLTAGLAGCGSDEETDTSADTSTTAGTGPTTTGATTTSEAPTTTAPPTTAAPTTAPSTTAAGGGSDRPTVADLEVALDADIEATFPDVGPGTTTCEGSGTLGEWQAVICHFLPDEPREFGALHVSMLDGRRYNYESAPCCDAGPWPDAYPSGLFCRDLNQPPPDETPGHYQPELGRLTYGLAMFYWLSEGRPDRMDADLDGIPCETVYPAAEVDRFWSTVRTL